MSNCKENTFHYGGQAVIEGVMMRGKRDFSVAVRTPEGDIVTTTEDVDSLLGGLKWLNKPFLRGTFALIDSMYLGIKALKYAADIAMTAATTPANATETVADPQEGTTETTTPAKPSKVNDIAVGFALVAGLALGLAIFMLIPILVVRPLRPHFHSWQLAVIEGLVKITLFVAYVYLISLMKDIRRVFQYHGAEHMVINAFENGADLTVPSIRKYGTIHVRCGTSFVLVVLVISIVVFMFIPWDNILLRFAYKLLLLPLVAGIAYEIIKVAGNHKNSLFSRIFLMPGLLMQRVTTQPPDDSMIEVAIASLKGVHAAEEARCQATPAVIG